MVVHHTTFCVNSVAHFFGDHTFDDERTPKDHFITALMTLGEGYHNFHHEFPNGTNSFIFLWVAELTQNEQISAMESAGSTTILPSGRFAD